MKVQYISDIHTEFLDPVLQIPTVVHNIRNGVPDAQVLILGGDIGAYYRFSNLELFLDMICPLYDYVIYIKGNHEYYSPNEGYITLDLINREFASLEKDIRSLYILDNSDICIDGKTIVGSTLWFDTTHPEAVIYSMYLNDYKLIPGGRESLDLMAENAYTYINSLPSTLESPIDILLCHHGVAPVFHEKHREANNNVFFYRDISNVIAQMDVRHIIHGHQHDNHYYDLPTNIKHCSDQRVGVHMNCKGYPSEHPDGFSYSKYIEI